MTMIAENHASVATVTPWSKIVDNAITAGDDNVSSFAHRIGIRDQTLRGQLRDGRSPTYNDLVHLAPRLPATMLQGLLQALAGHRFEIRAVEPAARESDPLSASIGTVNQASALVRRMNEAMRDDRVDDREYREISSGILALEQETAETKRQLDAHYVPGLRCGPNGCV